MNTPPPNATSTESLVYPIRTVASLTGVSPLRLRAWERRYKLLEPTRTAGGHRVYSQQDIDRIRKVVSLLDRGMAISQVSELVASESAGQSTGPSQSPWPAYQDRVAAVVARFDEAALESIYSELAGLHPVEQLTRQVFLPLLTQLGTQWQSATGAIAQEHFLAVYLRNKLGARFHHRTHHSSGPLLVVACLPDEQHEAGAFLFSLAAHDRGYRLVMLGANMPVNELAYVVDKTGADALVLSGSNEQSAEWFGRQLSGLVAKSACPVFIGGPIALARHDEIVGIGALPLGCDIESALNHIAQCLGQRAVPAGVSRGS